MNRLLRSIIPVLLSAVGGVAAHADQPDGQPVNLRMEGWWGGLKGADILFTIDRGPTQWDGRFIVHSAGILHWLTGLVAEADGHGAIGGLAALPQFYEQHVTSRKSERIVEVDFAGNPALAHRVKDQEISSDPAKKGRDPENVPELPADQLRGTADPIAAILTLGRRALAGEKSFTLPIYDGRRRFDLAVRLVGPGTHGLNGRPTPTLDVIATVHPVAGFKPYHLKWWNNATFDVYLDPMTGLPLQISSSSFTAAVVLTARAECPPQPACELPKRN